ncbi:MAG: hypothetical protein Q4E53_09080, partial [Eubacteriales bacterium]|nr:hypothetical protein [Eubacteriales bacterium]
MMMKKNKSLKIFMIVCLFLFLVGCSFSKESHGMNDLDGKNMITMYFKEIPNLSAEEAENNYEILKDRIEVFCEGFSYELEKKGNLITFVFPEERLAYFNPLDVSDIFLSKPMDYEVIVNEKSLEFTPEDIQLLEEGSGIIDGVESSETTQFLRYQFTEDYAKKLEGNQPGEIESIHLVDNNIYRGYDTKWYIVDWELFRGKDGFYYQIYDDAELICGNEKIYIYDMTHDKMTVPYNCYEKKRVVWESDGDFGQYQKKADEFNENNYYVQFSCDEQWTNDLRIKEENNIKGRLDSLRIPYSFGVLEEGGFAFQMEKMPLTESMMDSMADDNQIYLRCDNHIIRWVVASEYNDMQIDWMDEEEVFHVMVPNKDMKKIKEWMKTSGKALYLGIGNENHIVASMESVNQMKGSSLVFKPIDGKDACIDLMKEIILSPKFEKYYSMDFCKKEDQLNDPSLYVKDDFLQSMYERTGNCLNKRLFRGNGGLKTATTPVF